MIDGMKKLALTGQELAELYVMESMGVPEELGEGDSFLYDTPQGRQQLISGAYDILNNIRTQNDDHMDRYVDDYINENQPPDWDTLVGWDETHQAIPIARSVLMKQLSQFGLLDHDPDEPPEDQGQFSFASLRTAQQQFDTMPQTTIPDDELNRGVWEFIKSLGLALDIDRVTQQRIWDTWNFLSSTEKPDFAKRDFTNYILNELSEDPEILQAAWDQERDRLMEGKDYLDPHEDRDEIVRMLIEMEFDNPHMEIEDKLQELSDAITRAQGSDDRRDFIGLMCIIDDLSSMSHHGGPAFEYADSTWGRGEPDMIEVMNRKFGDRFIPWAISNDLISRETLDQIQRWYDRQVEEEAHWAHVGDLHSGRRPNEELGETYNRRHEAPDYYRHPMFSEPGDWRAKKSPTFQQWTPFSPEEEAMANYRSLRDAREKGYLDWEREFVIDQFLRRHRPTDEPMPVDPTTPRPRLSEATDTMLKLAQHLDEADQPDLADRMTKVALLQHGSFAPPWMPFNPMYSDPTHVTYFPEIREPLPPAESRALDRLSRKHWGDRHPYAPFSQLEIDEESRRERFDQTGSTPNPRPVVNPHMRIMNELGEQISAEDQRLATQARMLRLWADRMGLPVDTVTQWAQRLDQRQPRNWHQRRYEANKRRLSDLRNNVEARHPAPPDETWEQKKARRRRILDEKMRSERQMRARNRAQLWGEPIDQDWEERLWQPKTG